MVFENLQESFCFSDMDLLEKGDTTPIHYSGPVPKKRVRLSMRKGPILYYIMVLLGIIFLLVRAFPFSYYGNSNSGLPCRSLCRSSLKFRRPFCLTTVTDGIWDYCDRPQIFKLKYENHMTYAYDVHLHQWPYYMPVKPPVAPTIPSFTFTATPQIPSSTITQEPWPLATTTHRVIVPHTSTSAPQTSTQVQTETPTNAASRTLFECVGLVPIALQFILMQ
jgi:hypothetical protein